MGTIEEGSNEEPSKDKKYNSKKFGGKSPPFHIVQVKASNEIDWFNNETTPTIDNEDSKQ